MEAQIATALDLAGLRYEAGPANTAGLDFHLPDYGVFIEVKQFHSPRIAEQMSRAPDVIAVQGAYAVAFLAKLLAGSAALKKDAGDV